MRTKVLIKHKREVHWEDPEVGAYPDEARLKTILRDDPALFPFDESRRPVVMVDEFPVSIGETYGFVDLVGVSAAGSITIVECKLEKNPDIKRRLVGQLIEYAAGLWGMSFEEFDARWQAVARPGMMTDEAWEQRKRPPLEDDIASTVEGDCPSTGARSESRSRRTSAQAGSPLLSRSTASPRRWSAASST